MPTVALRREFAKSVIDLAVRRAFRGVPGHIRREFFGLLAVVQSRSPMVRPRCLEGRVDVASLTRLLGGLVALASYRKDWIRPACEWEPVASTPLPLFRSLAGHLMAEYPVPPVLASAWFRGLGHEGRREQGWYKAAGRGVSLRAVGFPLQLTRRMAQEFCDAPAHLPVRFALRWAQVRGLGGTEVLAEAVASTRLGWRYYGDDFWVSFIHFLINHPGFDLTRLHDVVAYLFHEKFDGVEVTIGEGVQVTVGPPRPDLSLKGWSAASLLRRVEEWLARRAEPVPQSRKVFRWESSGVSSRSFFDGEGGWLTVREILDSDALAAEGVSMNHCVATYLSHCLRGHSSIWSLGRETDAGRERLVTIEVDPKDKCVLQVRSKDNEEPASPYVLLIKAWARRAGLEYLA